MEDQFKSKKNPFVEWLKNWATKILLFTVAMLLLALISFIFDSLGLIEPETYGSDPVDLIYQIFCAIVWIVGIFGIFAVIYEVWKNRKK